MDIQYAGNGDDIVEKVKEEYTKDSHCESGSQPKETAGIVSVYDFRDTKKEVKRRVIIFKLETNDASLVIHKREKNDSQWEERDDIIFEAANLIQGGLELTMMRVFLRYCDREIVSSDNDTYSNFI